MSANQPRELINNTIIIRHIYRQINGSSLVDKLILASVVTFTGSNNGYPYLPSHGLFSSLHALACFFKHVPYPFGHLEGK